MKDLCPYYQDGSCPLRAGHLSGRAGTTLGKSPPPAVDPTFDLPSVPPVPFLIGPLSSAQLLRGRETELTHCGSSMGPGAAGCLSGLAHAETGAAGELWGQSR